MWHVTTNSLTISQIPWLFPDFSRFTKFPDNSRFPGFPGLWEPWTSAQSNLTTGCIAVARVWLNGIRQMAPVRMPSNTCFLGPTRVYTPNGISISSAVFAGPPYMQGSIVFGKLRQCAAHVTPASLGSPESTTQTASRSVQPVFYSSPQCVGSHLTHSSLGPPESKSQKTARSVQLFLHSSPWQRVPIDYNWLPLPHQNCPFPCGNWTPI